MTQREYQCGRCQRPAPSGRTVYIRNVPLGPYCAEVVQRREKIRASGSHPRILKDPDTGLVHTTSDYGDQCPEDDKHCLQCTHLADSACPAEEEYGELFPSLFRRR